eukprot:5973267-Pleurochrysis_carterae.AAC.1
MRVIQIRKSQPLRRSKCLIVNTEALSFPPPSQTALCAVPNYSRGTRPPIHTVGHEQQSILFIATRNVLLARKHNVRLHGLAKGECYEEAFPGKRRSKSGLT